MADILILRSRLREVGNAQVRRLLPAAKRQAYLFEGRIIHRDSIGSVQPIEPGAINWMTAA